MLIGVHVLALVHIVHWRLAGTTLSPLEPSEAMELAKHDVINAGLVFFAAAILSTAIFGRFFCGWACHLVALQDLCSLILRRLGLRPRPLRSRWLRLVPLAAFFYMFLWPAAYRLWLGDHLGPVEQALLTSDFWATFPGWAVALLTFGVCGFAIVYFLGHKGFCTYACPYGAIFGLVDKLAPTKILVTDACAGCGHCTAVCTSNVRVHEEVRDFGKVIDAGCMKTLDCVAACPNDALHVGIGTPSLFSKPRRDRPAVVRGRLGWRQEAILAAAFVAAFFTFRGLYGLVPFLLALGLSAILAYLVLMLVRLLTEPNLRLRRFTLKTGGRWRPAGRGFAALMAGLGVFWVHSAVVRLETHRGTERYHLTASFRARALEAHSVSPPLTAAEEDLVEKAVRHLSRARRLSLVPSGRMAAQLAFMHRLAGDPEAFLARAGEALSLGADIPLMQALLAVYHIEQGRYAQAVAAYRSGLDADPEVLELHLGLTALLARLGEVEAADQVARQGLAVFPRSSDLHYNAGLVATLTGDVERAIALFSKALELEPENLRARENLAGVLAGSGRFRASLEHFRRAVEQSPDDPVTYLLMARVHLALGELDAAASSVARALELDPQSGQARSLGEEIDRQLSSSSVADSGRR